MNTSVTLGHTNCLPLPCKNHAICTILRTRLSVVGLFRLASKRLVVVGYDVVHPVPVGLSQRHRISALFTRGKRWGETGRGAVEAFFETRRCLTTAFFIFASRVGGRGGRGRARGTGGGDRVQEGGRRRDSARRTLEPDCERQPRHGSKKVARQWISRETNAIHVHDGVA